MQWDSFLEAKGQYPRFWWLLKLAIQCPWLFSSQGEPQLLQKNLVHENPDDEAIVGFPNEDIVLPYSGVESQDW